MAPRCFRYEHGTKRSEIFGNVLRQSYLPHETIDVRSFAGLNHLFSDSIIGFAVHRLVHLISNQTDVFYYKFSYIGRFSVFNYPADKPYGVHHADDLQYPFYFDKIAPLIKADDPESFMIERMTRIFEHFAVNG